MLHNGSRQKTFFLMSFKGTGKLYFIFIRMSSLFRLRKPAFSTYSFGKLASCLSLFAISCLFHVLNLMPSQDFETLDSSFRCYFLLCSKKSFVSILLTNKVSLIKKKCRTDTKGNLVNKI